jgi:hypothetical protein
LPKYAPSFENDTSAYIQQTIDRITRWADLPGAPPFTDFAIKSQTTMSRGQFADVLRAAGSPALPESDALYDLALANGVNPAVALAFFVKISRAGTGYANPAKADNHNWGEIAGSGNGVGGVQAYPTWLDGLRDWIHVVADIYGGEGRTTLSTVVPRYRPGGTTDPDGYAHALSDLIAGWKQAFDQFGFVRGQPPSN